MALPVLLWGAAAALGATGIVKGAKAVGGFSEAKEIGERAERKHATKLKELDELRQITNQECEDLGRLKLQIFQNQIGHVVSVLKRSKSTSSKISGFQSMFSIEDIKEMEKMVDISEKFATGSISGGAQGVLAGGLAGLGVYGGIPLVATASTGTAISTLSGAAATNATLAWLGGGSLASGGFGMAGGMVALGGIVAGPALAITGFVLASKAEEALSDAKKYRARINEAVAQIEMVEVGLNGVRENIVLVTHALLELVERFESVKSDDYNQHMFEIGKAIKSLLDEKIMLDDGSPALHIRQTCSGYLEI